MQKPMATYPWGDAIPYHSYRSYILKKFGRRVQKVSVNAGFTCPNRDGSKGTGGCIYCNNDSFTPGYLNNIETIETQLAEGIDFLKRRYGAENFIAYFQANSNTYAPLEDLKKIYHTALSHSEVIGLAIGTRPDCIDEQIIAYLHELSKNYDVSVEYGLESSYDTTLEYINRCHTVADFEKAVFLTAGKGIHITTHLILGLPGETTEMLLQTARYISGLPVHSLKLHHLHIVEKTLLATQYRENPFSLYTMRAYIELVADFLRRIRPDITIQRVVGETNPGRLIAPQWGVRASFVVQELERYMREKGYYQGQLWTE